MALEIGEIVGPYRIVEQLGQGGMATVYKAHHESLDRYVAIKVLHPAFLEDTSFLARFRREAQIVARLDHPHIVPVYDYSEHRGQPFLVMKFVEGLTLKHVLMSQRLAMQEILDVMTPVAQALDYAHRQGVLHRDIKPSNVVIDQNGTPYLTDFGLARMALAGESTMSQDMMLGTPHYISPEQAKGIRDLDARADLYSLGVVLYEMIVGRVPFNADTPYAVVHDHIYTPLPLPSKLNPDVSEGVERVLLKALAKDPAHRFSSAVEMVEALRAAAPGGPVEQATLQEPLPEVAPESARRKGSSSSVAASMRGVKESLKQAGDEWRAALSNAEDVGEVIEEVAQEFGWGDKRKQKEKRSTGVSKSDGGYRYEIAIPTDDVIRKRVEQRMKDRSGFLVHFAIYFTIMVMLWVIWGREGVRETLEMPWPLFPMLGWGSGVAAHAVQVLAKSGRQVQRQERRIQATMRERYGSNWRATTSDEEYVDVRRKIYKRYQEYVGFYTHAAVFTAINAMLWIIWSSSWFFEGKPMEFPWPLFPLIFWGMGLVAHGVQAITAGSRHVSGALEREIEREQQRVYGSEDDYEEEKPKRDRGVRLNQDGELTDSYAAEWDREEKSRRR